MTAGQIGIAHKKMFILDPIKKFIGKALIHYLEQPSVHYRPIFAPNPERLHNCLQPGDVLLIDGNTRLSAAIKYLTQSTWSHSALYVGDALGTKTGDEPNVLIEALAEDGVVGAPLSKYAAFNNRICRPCRLSDARKEQVIDYCVRHIGQQYDIRHAFDLARYLIPFPPVPIALRRRLLAFGSGDPTRAICSTLIASAFHAVHYPVLPINGNGNGNGNGDEVEPDEESRYFMSEQMKKEITHIYKYGLFTPRDFDISPYFDIIKPTLEEAGISEFFLTENDEQEEDALENNW